MQTLGTITLDGHDELRGWKIRIRVEAECENGATDQAGDHEERIPISVPVFVHGHCMEAGNYWLGRKPQQQLMDHKIGEDVPNDDDGGMEHQDGDSPPTSPPSSPSPSRPILKKTAPEYASWVRAGNKHRRVSFADGTKVGSGIYVEGRGIVTEGEKEEEEYYAENENYDSSDEEKEELNKEGEQDDSLHPPASPSSTSSCKLCGEPGFTIDDFEAYRRHVLWYHPASGNRHVLHRKICDTILQCFPDASIRDEHMPHCVLHDGNRPPRENHNDGDNDDDDDAPEAKMRQTTAVTA